MGFRLIGVVFGVFAAGAAQGAGPGCGGEDAPCEIEGGSYHLALPDSWDGESRLPAIVFLHGHNSSGAPVMRGSVRRVFGEAGYAVIAPNGAMRAGSSLRAWPGRPGAGPRDDVAFVTAVVDEIAETVPLDLDRIVVGGFSAGGSMAWMLGCYEGARFEAVVSVAGALRRPVPEEGCAGGPISALQIHGFADAQVPLEGRAIRDWHQGAVSETFGLARDAAGCRSNPTGFDLAGLFRCRIWDASGCAADVELRLCLHDGGHGLPGGWAEAALAWIEARRAE